MRNDKVRKEAQARSLNWWYCDNIVNEERHGQVGLLKMDFPQCFVLIRDEADCYFSSFDEFKEHIAEVNYFNPADRSDENTEGILIDAWNFMALQEEEEERQAILRDEEELLDDEF